MKPLWCLSNRMKSELNLVKMKLAAVLKICENTDDMSFEKKKPVN